MYRAAQIGFREDSGLYSFKNFKNLTTVCEDIAYCLVWYFILSHLVVFANYTYAVTATCQVVRALLEAQDSQGHPVNLAFKAHLASQAVLVSQVHLVHMEDLAMQELQDPRARPVALGHQVMYFVTINLRNIETYFFVILFRV